jgi:hypothetical protein
MFLSTLAAFTFVSTEKEKKNGRASSSREEHEERFYDEKGDGGYKFKLEN